ncbi:methyl-accepting chemotaxis protein [Vibrio sinaloensis]|uniref:methyl-accepting chemotaxis protein n=1 Tax=Photobacterium sp. (strain ATCC 43367) TaxID=379097 RepID=UPI00205D3EF1|nr:methyl-accepting chemotaxis protein [Vibrio sinaloensis]UPQ86881.1 methyl-accepting chemotaxis protein [Vibrio sinaloensis]
MNLTVISRTILGFSIVVVLMTLLAGMGFYAQKQSSSAYKDTAETLIPIMERSFQLAIIAQNVNKAVSQHASALDTSQRRALEQEFDAAVKQYTELRTELSKSLSGRAELTGLLQRADQTFSQAFLLGQQQIAAQNELVRTKDVSRAEIQNYTARWITFADERDAAVLLATKLGLVENFAVSVIADSLTLAQTTLGGVSNIENLALLNNIKQKLSQSALKTVSRIDKLAGMAPDSAEKLKPFVDFLNYSVNDERGYLSLQIKLVSLGEQINRNLADMGSLVNSGADTLDELSQSIDALVATTNQQVESAAESNILMTSILFIVAIVVSVLIVLTQIRSIRTPLKSITNALSALSDGHLDQHIDLKKKDEFGEIAGGINELADKLGGVLSQLKESSSTLSHSTQGALDVTVKSEEMLENQKFQTSSVATAVTEMESAVYEVARNAESSLGQVLAIRELASTGKSKMDMSINSINELDSDIKSAAETIGKMKQESENIEGILEVITGIAEQTNLLALNAAIEAARAGEQGRGFAVVADEVRNLASKTQNSTEEIYRMIQSLQKISVSSVDIMHKNSETAKQVVDNSQQAASSLFEISTAIDSVANMSEQIASAAQEQSHVSKEITENVVSISDAAEEIHQLSRGNRQTFADLMSLSDQQAKITEQFKM